MSLSILITCLLDNVWILQREVTHYSPLKVKGLKHWGNSINNINASRDQISKPYGIPRTQMLQDEVISQSDGKQSSFFHTEANFISFKN